MALDVGFHSTLAPALQRARATPNLNARIVFKFEGRLTRHDPLTADTACHKMRISASTKGLEDMRCSSLKYMLVFVSLSPKALSEFCFLSK